MPDKSSLKVKKLSRRDVRDLDIKISFMEGIVRRDPRYIEALQILGDHYTQRGRFGHSLKVDKRLSRLEPRNPLVFYNLACSYCLLKKMEEGVTALVKAVANGFNDFKWLLKDPDLAPLRKDPHFKKVWVKISTLQPGIP